MILKKTRTRAVGYGNSSPISCDDEILCSNIYTTLWILLLVASDCADKKEFTPDIWYRIMGKVQLLSVRKRIYLGKCQCCRLSDVFDTTQIPVQIPDFFSSR